THEQKPDEDPPTSAHMQDAASPLAGENGFPFRNSQQSLQGSLSSFDTESAGSAQRDHDEQETRPKDANARHRSQHYQTGELACYAPQDYQARNHYPEG